MPDDQDHIEKVTTFEKPKLFDLPTHGDNLVEAVLKISGHLALAGP